ncbi:MAG: P-loop NTPase [Acidimicrobiia bacterium]
MNRIEQIVVVGSGKGGVGKSTVSLNLALALHQQGNSVGIMDADLYGPNIPIMVGITRTQWGRSWMLAYNPKVMKASQIQPEEAYGLKVMSAAFIVGEDQPLVWEGGMVQGLAMQFVGQVAWGDLDYLIVDLPPGSGEIPQILLRNIDVAGAIVVVTPPYVAHLDARKAVQMYRQANVKIIGGVENMSAHVCPHCGQREEIFVPAPHSRSIWAMGVQKLVDIPLDPSLGHAGDVGPPLMIAKPQSPQADAFRRLANAVSSGAIP